MIFKIFAAFLFKYMVEKYFRFIKLQTKTFVKI